MKLFKRKKEENREINENSIEDPILRALLLKDDIDRDTIMNIPSVSSCVNRIADTVSSLEIKLYRKESNKVEEVTNDRRTKLLNDDTGDTLTACELKKQMVIDMFLSRGGYAYVNSVLGEVESIHYVAPNRIGFQYNTDPIFKDYKIQVNGQYYEGWQFIKLLRNTEDGFRGKSIIEESETLLSLIYATQLFEKNMVKTGGNKKGFLKSQTRLTEPAMNALKDAFRSLYKNNTENVVVLNDGLDFKESSNTSVELQLNENKRTNNDDICKVFLVPPSIISGGATEEDKKEYYEGCIIPIINRFAKAINSVLLREDEKDTLFFAFDTTDLLKGDIEKRYNAFKTAIDSGFMQVDDVRRKENLPAFGLNFIKLGLQDVLYFPEKDEIYTPNTNQTSKLNGEINKKGGESDDANRD